MRKYHFQDPVLFEGTVRSNLDRKNQWTDTKIILMDEATASLDLETESYLNKAIEESLQDKTVLLIAHRPESIQHCDKVLELPIIPESSEITGSSTTSTLFRV